MEHDYIYNHLLRERRKARKRKEAKERTENKERKRGEKEKKCYWFSRKDFLLYIALSYNFVPVGHTA